MPRTPGAVGVAALLRTPGARRAFPSSVLVRLSYGTVTLSLLLTVRAATGSSAAAGAALGAFGLPALLGPYKARAVDRYGTRAVLAPLSLGYATTLGVLAGLPHAHTGAYVTLAAAAGTLTPPVGPVMRAIWAALTPTLAARQRAYALDAVLEEVSFAAGPLLVGAVVVLSGPRAALLGTAALALVGGLGLAERRAPTGSSRERARSPLGSRPLRRVLLVMLAVGVGLGPVELAVADLAVRAGTPAAAGWLLGCLSAGSVVGGLLWSRVAYGQRLVLPLAVLTTGAAAAAAAPGLVTLGLALAVTGLAVAPTFVLAYLAADASAPAAARTEAGTWVATANNVGGAAGAAAAGVLLDATSAAGALLAGAAVLAGAGLLASRNPEDGADSVEACPST